MLTFQEDRLSREVSRQQQLYSTLSQAYEQAKIEEVRDTPVFTLVDEPELPARPNPRFLVLKLPLALIVGGIIGLFLGLVREFGLAASRRQDPDYLALSIAARDVRTELRHPRSLVRRLFGFGTSPGGA